MRLFGLEFGWAKASVTEPAVAAMFPPNLPIHPPGDYRAYAAEGYRKNATVYACVSAIQKAVGAVEWQLVRRRGGRNIEVDEHPLLRLLNRPNPETGGAQFWAAHIGFLMIAGNGYIEKIAPERGGPPLELWNLRPDRMKVNPGALAGLVSGYVYETGIGQGTAIEATEVLHRKLWNPLDDVYGMSPVQAAALAIEQANDGHLYNAQLLKNGARPGGVLVSDKPIPDSTREDVKDRIRRQIAGPGNAGQLMFLGPGVRFEKTGLSPSELEWLAGLAMTVREICKVFDVPPEVVGEHEHATYSNYKEARKSLITEAVLPRLNALVSDLNAWLTPQFDSSLTITYNRDAFPSLQDERSELWDRGLAAMQVGGLSVNEWRQLVGYDEAEWGAVRYVPVNMFPEPVKLVEGPLSVKAIRRNMSEEQKTDHWKAIDRRQASWAKRIGARIGDQFDEDARLMKRTLREADERGLSSMLTTLVPESIVAHEESWERLMASIYTEVGNDFASSVYRGVKSATGPHDSKLGDLDDMAATQRWRAGIDDYFRRVGLKRVKEDILPTEKVRIIATLRAGIDEHEGVDALAARIDTEMLWQKSTRAQVIARTEVHAASGVGSREGARATGIDLLHEWLSTRGDRTRGSDSSDEFDHVEPDGQRQKLDDPFVVSGEDMMFPGDSSLGASAGNVIECRCTETYVPSDEEVEMAP